MRKEKIEKIKKEVKKEFPNDDALQQIHIARKILYAEAKENNMSFWKYIKMQIKNLKKESPGAVI